MLNIRLILCRSSTPIAKNIGYYNDIEDSIVDDKVAHSKKKEKNKIHDMVTKFENMVKNMCCATSSLSHQNDQSSNDYHSKSGAKFNGILSDKIGTGNKCDG